MIAPLRHRGAEKPSILLVFPSNNVTVNCRECSPEDAVMKVVPIGVIALAAYLEARGVGVEILDCRFYTPAEAMAKLDAAIPRHRFFGISAMTSQVKHALQISDRIRTFAPSAITIWGGVHATLFPEETCRDPAVDYVFKGEAEKGLHDLITLLHEGPPAPDTLSRIEGLCYKEPDGTVRVNAEGPPPEMDDLPLPAYHLLEIEKYVGRRTMDGRPMRGLDILTSRGCPYRCAFCVVPFLSNRKWRSLSVERVLADIETLVSRHDLSYLWFMDDYFFGNKRWVNGVVDGILARARKFVWEANVRADNFRDTFVNDGLLARMRASGCYALRMGLESGSERVLKLISKDVKVPMLTGAVEAAARHGIMTVGTWLMGVPSETRREIQETLALIQKVHETSPLDPHWAPGIYRPYPGGELYHMALESGFVPPKTLRDWADFNLHWGTFSARALPWVEEPGFVDDVVLYGEMVLSEHLGGRFLAPRRIFDRMARYRYRTGFWDYRADAWLFRQVKSGYHALRKVRSAV